MYIFNEGSEILIDLDFYTRSSFFNDLDNNSDNNLFLNRLAKEITEKA